MFFFLSKTLYLLVMPAMWIVYSLLMALLGPRRFRRASAIACLALFLLFTNGVLVNEVMRWWEREPVPFSDVPACDTGVLLTGFTQMNILPADRLHLNEGADRLVHTIRLYHEGKIKRVVVSGAYKTLHYEVQEAPLIKAALLRSGIPDSAIIMESESRNTYENALNTTKLLKNEEESLMLITSAFHMRRSEACFAKQKLHPVLFPTDFRSTNQDYTFEYYIPSEDNLSKWQTLFREWLGMLAYKLKGYI